MKQLPWWRYAAFPNEVGPWSGAYPSIQDVHKHLGKCQKNITLLKAQFPQQNSTKGTFSLTNLSLWDEHLASRAWQSRWGRWLHLIKHIPAPCFGRRFPVGSQQSPCLFSTGRALKMKSKLWKHHPPCTRNACPRAQRLQPLPWSSHQLFGLISKVNPADKLSSLQRNTVNTMKNHSERQMHFT